MLFRRSNIRNLFVSHRSRSHSKPRGRRTRRFESLENRQMFNASSIVPVESEPYSILMAQETRPVVVDLLEGDPNQPAIFGGFDARSLLPYIEQDNFRANRNFPWLAHLDRQIVSPAEQLLVRGFSGNESISQLFAAEGGGSTGEGFSFELGFAMRTTADGSSIKPQFAFYVEDLDNRLNANGGTDGIPSDSIVYAKHCEDDAQGFILPSTLALRPVTCDDGNPCALMLPAGAPDDCDNAPEECSEDVPPYLTPLYAKHSEDYVLAVFATQWDVLFVLSAGAFEPENPVAPAAVRCSLAKAMDECFAASGAGEHNHDATLATGPDDQDCADCWDNTPFCDTSGEIEMVLRQASATLAIRDVSCDDGNPCCVEFPSDPTAQFANQSEDTSFIGIYVATGDVNGDGRADALFVWGPLELDPGSVPPGCGLSLANVDAGADQAGNEGSVYQATLRLIGAVELPGFEYYDVSRTHNLVADIEPGNSLISEPHRPPLVDGLEFTPSGPTGTGANAGGIGPEPFRLWEVGPDGELYPLGQGPEGSTPLNAPPTEPGGSTQPPAPLDADSVPTGPGSGPFGPNGPNGPEPYRLR